MKRGTTPPAAYVRVNRISCNPCRKRKLKCDRVKPCSTCQKRKIVDQCYRDDREEGIDDRASTHSSSKRSKGAPSISGTTEGDEPSPLSVHSIDGLEHIKDQFESIARLAHQSSQSLDASILSFSQQSNDSELERVEKLKNKVMITWTDISDHVPSIKDCEDLIAFFFDKLSYYIRIVPRSNYERNWRMLLYGHDGIPKVEASIILTSFALAAILTPANAPLKKHSRKDQGQWMMLLGDATSSPPLGEAVDNSYSKIMLLGMTSVYHLYEGKPDGLWECIGIMIRKAIVYGLYDERRKVWATLNPLEKEYHRRIGWYALSLERWQAFSRRLPFALQTKYVYLGEPTFDPDEEIMRNPKPVKIVTHDPLILPDGRWQPRFSPRVPLAVKFTHIELLSWCQDFLDDFNSMEPATRYNRATMLDEVLERTQLDGLDGTGINKDTVNLLNSDALEACVEDRRIEINLWVSSVFFLRCIITRRFLMDENAPPNLRFASLTYAQGILATFPSLARIIKEGKRPLQTTWNANHLLAAATTFTVVILGQDKYVDSQADLSEADTSESKTKTHFPKEQMDWLAENIFTTLEGLQGLVRIENHTASVAKQLLEKLCTSQSDLRALYLQRFNDIRSSEGNIKPQQVDLLKKEPTPIISTPEGSLQQSLDGRSESLRPFSFISPAISSVPSSNNGDYTMTLQPSNKDTTYLDLASGKSAAEVSSISDQWLKASMLQPMSASSLLDAVLMDPTELNFTGAGTYSDVLASLLQDNPTPF